MLEMTKMTTMTTSTGDVEDGTGTADESLLRCRRALLQSIFNSIDSNGDGQVAPTELANTLQNEKDIPPRVIHLLFKRGDTNHDGYISFEEFCTLVEQPDTMTFFRKFFHIPEYKAIQERVVKYRAKCRWMPPPVINLIIIIVQIIIFTVDGMEQKRLQQALEFTPSNKIEIWRYYTYSLIHSNWAHIVGNSIVQIFFGTALEPVHGYRVAFVFIVGVFAGSLTHAVIENSSLVGASAGVYALIFSWLSDIFLVHTTRETAQKHMAPIAIYMLLQNWSEQECPMVSLLPVIIFIVWDMVMATNATSVTAHIAGGVSGFLCGMIVLKNLKVQHCERVAIGIACVFCVLYFIVFILLNCFNVHT